VWTDNSCAPAKRGVIVGIDPLPNLFSPLFSADTVVVESAVHLVDDQLMPEELGCIRQAVERRRAQFGTGRLCARRALALLGLPVVPITVGPGGAPLWPAGAVGSITHTSTYCAVAVKPTPPWRSVGLDAEDLRPIDPSIVPSVLTDSERLWLEDLHSDARDVHALLVFSAKEAYYKLQYPLTGRFLDFHDVEIEVDQKGDAFRVRTRADVPAVLASIEGRFAFAEGKILCGIELL